MVKDRDDLDKPLMGKGKNDVAGSEAGVQTPIYGCDSKFVREARRSRVQPVRVGGI
jgi:hypothetical protein